MSPLGDNIGSSIVVASCNRESKKKEKKKKPERKKEFRTRKYLLHNLRSITKIIVS
jgi:hypothetical protein